MNIIIRNTKVSYKEEALKTAFGFKGSSLSCLWQTVVRLESENNFAIGLGVQSVLWSDAKIFKTLGEEKGNEAMFSLTEYAIEKANGMTFENPVELTKKLYDLTYEYAKGIFGDDLRKTFVLNALVPIDFAAWGLWAKENKIEDFDKISVFDGKKEKMLLNIPLITYKTGIEEIVRLAEDGTALFKIKIGSDPDKDGNLDKMLEWDKNRIKEIHDALKDIKTPYTKDGHILYYLDANGRYDTKERLSDFLDFADKLGILNRIILLEEPFSEENKINVSDLPVTIAADESAHSVEDVIERAELGYKALTLKPIAKTLSITIEMANEARKKDMEMFCADLTVNPLMVSWNQLVASRLNNLSNMKIGVVESNGEQNYVNWEEMKSYHPMNGETFTICENGVFTLDDTFYKENGGVFKDAKYYIDLIGNGDR